MAKRQGHERGAGPYSQNDMKLTRPRNVDPETGDVRQRKRELLDDVDAISGMGLSRPITKAPAKRYGP